MNILFAADTPDTRETGIARIMHGLREALVEKGHEVRCLFHEDVATTGLGRRIENITFPVFLVFKILAIRKSGNKRLDVVALHSLAAWAYVFARRVFKSLPPCVVVSYGSDEMRWELEEEEARLGLRKLRLFSRIFYYNGIIRLARYATRRADHVIVSAKTEIVYFEKKYGMLREEVSFLPNGVSPDFFTDRNYSRPVKNLLFLGGWEWRKGIRYLTEAFICAAEEMPELNLCLAGVGVSEVEAKKNFPESLHARIRVLSRIEARQTPRIYEESDIFIFPSLFESMSLVVPEAMASGMPVITTRACGMQDIIEDGINGCLVPPRDSLALVQRIRELAGDRNLRERLGRKAQLKARELLWTHVADQALAVYIKAGKGRIQ